VLQCRSLPCDNGSDCYYYQEVVVSVLQCRALPCHNGSVCTAAAAACLLVQIESRFRFLAADSTATMRGKRPSYKEALLLIRDRSAAQLGSSSSSSEVSSITYVDQQDTCALEDCLLQSWV
jgi:hypothetical protein